MKLKIIIKLYNELNIIPLSVQSVLHGKTIQIISKVVKNEGVRIKNIFLTIIFSFVFLSSIQVVEGMYTEGNKVINNVDVILLILNWVPSLSVDYKRYICVAVSSKSNMQ